MRLNPKLGGDVLRAADALYREQIEKDPPLPLRVLADLLDAGWSAGDVEAWLLPLGNLRRFSTGDLEGVVHELVKQRDDWVAR